MQVKMNGNVSKITRTNGKAFAQVTISVPSSKSGEVPMGDVIIIMEATQSSIEDVLPKRAVRGDRG